MNMLKKKSKVYEHIKDSGILAIRVCGKWLNEYVELNQDIVVTINKKEKIILIHY